MSSLKPEKQGLERLRELTPRFWQRRLAGMCWGKTLFDWEPPLTKIIVEPTTRCNLTCRTCMRNTWDEAPGDMKWETFKSLMSGLEGNRSLKSMAFWGVGEPLLHPRIFDMIRSAVKRKLKTELITNGLLLSETVAGELVDAGLDTIVVSLDGATDQTQAELRGQADLEVITSNLSTLRTIREKLKSKKPKIGIEFVLTRRNLPELPDLILLARKLDVRFIVVSHVLPHSDSMRDEVLYWLNKDVYSAPLILGTQPPVLLPSVDLQAKYLNHLSRLSPDAVNNRASSWRTDPEGWCPFIWRGVTSVARDGSVSPCVALMHSGDSFLLDRPRRTNKYTLGNVKERSLPAIWDDREYREYRKQVREFEFSPCTSCGGCAFSEDNTEDCFGNQFPTCSGCLWAKGVLFCP